MLSRSHSIARALLYIALTLMIIHALIYAAFGVTLIPFPFDYDQAEGFELNNSILMAQGKCPYCDNDTFPFYGSGYPPLFHIIMIPFVWIFGPDFWYGRLIIFLSTLVTAGTIAWAVQREETHRTAAILAGLSFLASNYIYHIGPLLRQHLLMVMFEALAVVIIAKAFEAPQTQRRKILFAAFFLLLLAGYTKQLAISTCAAVFIWTFLRNPRTALVYSIGLALTAGLIFAGWMLITDGQWWINIISSNQNEYITEQFTGLGLQFIRLHWPLLLMSGVMVLYELYFARLSVYAVWFVVSIISTIGAGKWGAGDSYFATTIAAACILSGIFVGRSFRQAWVPSKNTISTRISIITNNIGIKSAAIWIGAGLFVIYGLTVLKMPTSGPIFGPLADFLNIEPLPSWRYPLYDTAGWTVGYAVTGHFPTESDIETGWEMIERVQETEGLVFAEDAGFMFKAGREVITNAVQLNNLWENGLYDPSNLIEMIENKEFGLIIRRANFFPEPVNIAIDTHYQHEETLTMNGFDYTLWRPKP